MANVRKRPVSLFLYLFICSLFSLVHFCHGVKIITKGQLIKDNETLISEDEKFELGFFSPENSKFRYVGIRYHKIRDQAVIWVANRQTPISDGSGALTIGEDGNFIIKDGNGDTVWSTNASVESNNPVAVLDISGNLVLSSNDSIGDISKAYWQSFNHPTDTYLPNMKVPLNSSTGEKHALTSWKSASDPSPGDFTMGVDTRGAGQIVIWKQSRRRWRSGHWNGQTFAGVPSMTAFASYQYGFKFTNEDDGNSTFTYSLSNPSDLMRFRISWDGYEEQLKWNESANEWVMVQRQPANDCELYNYCGNFGVCHASSSPICTCMEGFQPRYMDEWRKGIWTGGCVRTSPLHCEAGESSVKDGFKELRYVKLPDFAEVDSFSFETCRGICMDKDSCNAFAYATGIRCMLWMQDLTDVQQFDIVGNTLYLRIGLGNCGSDQSRKRKPIIIVTVILGAITTAICIFLLWKWVAKQRARKRKIGEIISSKSSEAYPKFSDGNIRGDNMDHVKLHEVPLFNLQELETATDYFNISNKLGKGGFGLVYRGILANGQDIAVKRLSRASGQGLEEFVNEVVVISKLQHRNLVRLLGCCVEGDEKMLVYEYMPNKSLDAFLFDPLKQEELDWEKRFNIVEGICRGLLYLHRDSRLRIIHRDLKASNILLDQDLNPKISDFGIAKIFGGNEDHADTRRVVGTFGYMSPEYAIEGRFSEKSDVFSFGVLLLEIVSGRRNTSFYDNEQALSLLGFAWKLWNEGNVAALVEPAMLNPGYQPEIFRCINVGLLCVQEYPKDRPTMSTVISMLKSEIVDLHKPKAPAFFERKDLPDTESFQPSQTKFSVNNVTVTALASR